MDPNPYSDGPVWHAFGLTRSAYLVVPRRALQSMPVEWQQRLVQLVQELHHQLPMVDGIYSVRRRDPRGRFGPDPLADYRHTGPLERVADRPLECESGAPGCGPVAHLDDDDTPLCERCWLELEPETPTQRRARVAGLSVVPDA